MRFDRLKPPPSKQKEPLIQTILKSPEQKYASKQLTASDTSTRVLGKGEVAGTLGSNVSI